MLGYFISYLPYALLAKALSSGIVPAVDKPIGGPVLLHPEPSATSRDDHRHTAVLIQQAVRQRLAEQFP